MTVSPDTYALTLLGKIEFVIVLPISRSCQSMVYRHVTRYKTFYVDYSLISKR